MPAPIVASIICRPGVKATGQSEASFPLIRRTGEPYRGCLALVGGKWQFGETVADAARMPHFEAVKVNGPVTAANEHVSERLVQFEEAS